MGTHASLSRDVNVDALITGKVYTRVNCLISGRSIIYLLSLMEEYLYALRETV